MYFLGHIYLKDQGCYKRDVLNTDRLVQVSNDLNPEKCKQFCKDAGSNFAAITFEDNPDVVSRDTIGGLSESTRRTEILW